MAMTNKSFKIETSTKWLIAGFLDPHKAGEFKRAMIDAQLSHTKAGQDGLKGWVPEKKEKKNKRNHSKITTQEVTV